MLDPVGGPYQLQAAIAACHAVAFRSAETDWSRIAALYARLGAIAPSPIIELNRAVAVAMADGPAAGLALVDRLVDEPALQGYHLLPSVRGDLLAKLGAAPEKLTPEDFRLRPDSAGYRAGKDKKDLGADVDLVGPGPAYERWKKTPDYQQWLKDTGQVKK